MTSTSEMKLQEEKLAVCWVEAFTIQHGTARRVQGSESLVFVEEIGTVKFLGRTVHPASKAGELRDALARAWTL